MQPISGGLPAMREGVRSSYHARMPRSRVIDRDAAVFGAIVARLRMERGWTLADFARFTGMNATWLGVLEHGRNVPSLTTILRLAAVFGIEASELMRQMEHARRKTPAGGGDAAAE